MVADGIYYAVALAAGGGLVSYLTRPLYGVPLFLAAAFCLYFFRDPDREVPNGPVAVSPADGKIVSIRRQDPQRTRIGIFMNIFDVHVNRAPDLGQDCGRPLHAGTIPHRQPRGGLPRERTELGHHRRRGRATRFHASRRPDRPAHRVPQEDGGNGAGRRARGSHQVRLAGGRVSGARVGDSSGARDAREGWFQRPGAPVRFREGGLRAPWGS